MRKLRKQNRVKEVELTFSKEKGGENNVTKASVKREHSVSNEWATA